MANRRDKYKQITDLFTIGAVLVPGEGMPPVWIQKLNGFQVEESRAHANARRALVVRSLNEVGNDATIALHNAADAMSREALTLGVIAAKYGRHMAETANALAGDPEWLEKQSILDRIDPNEALEPEQEKLVNDYNAEYFRRIREGIEERDREATAECEAMDDATLRKTYIDAFIEQRGTAVFTREQRVAEIVIGARICDAEPDDSGSYDDADHSGCNHVDQVFVDEPLTDDEGEPILGPDGTQRVRTAYEQVRAQPDEMFAAYTQAFDRLNVPRHTAKGSASRQSSSEPSRPQNEGEESAPSTPEEAPTPADGT